MKLLNGTYGAASVDESLAGDDDVVAISVISSNSIYDAVISMSTTSVMRWWIIFENALAHRLKSPHATRLQDRHHCRGNHPKWDFRAATT
jgi:hypothetical protein